MRARLALAALLGAVACAAAVAPARAADDPKVLTMVADNWCPFNCDPADANPGYLIELAKKVFEPEGYTIAYSIVPWTRAIEEVTAGKYDILIAASHDESPEILFPEGPAVSCGFDVFVRDDNPFVWKGVESVRDKRIGGVQNYMYSTAINAYIDENRKTPGHKVQIMRGDNALPLNIKKLLGGRIDVLFENAAVLNYQFAQMGKDLEDLGITGTPKKIGTADTAETMCYLGFTPAKPRSKELARLLTERAKKMEADGTMHALRVKYGIPE